MDRDPEMMIEIVIDHAHPQDLLKFEVVWGVMAVDVRTAIN